MAAHQMSINLHLLIILVSISFYWNLSAGHSIHQNRDDVKSRSVRAADGSDPPVGKLNINNSYDDPDKSSPPKSNENESDVPSDSQRGPSSQGNTTAKNNATEAIRTSQSSSVTLPGTPTNYSMNSTSQSGLKQPLYSTNTTGKTEVSTLTLAAQSRVSQKASEDTDEDGHDGPVLSISTKVTNMKDTGNNSNSKLVEHNSSVSAAGSQSTLPTTKVDNGTNVGPDGPLVTPIFSEMNTTSAAPKPTDPEPNTTNNKTLPVKKTDTESNTMVNKTLPIKMTGTESNTKEDKALPIKKTGTESNTQENKTLPVKTTITESNTNEDKALLIKTTGTESNTQENKTLPRKTDDTESNTKEDKALPIKTAGTESNAQENKTLPRKTDDTESNTKEDKALPIKMTGTESNAQENKTLPIKTTGTESNTKEDKTLPEVTAPDGNKSRDQESVATASEESNENLIPIDGGKEDQQKNLQTPDRASPNDQQGDGGGSQEQSSNQPNGEEEDYEPEYPVDGVKANSNPEHSKDNKESKDVNKNIKPDKRPVSTAPPESSNTFIVYFLVVIVTVVTLYIVYHNRQKLKGLVIEGRKKMDTRRTKRGTYSKLSDKADDVLPNPAYSDSIKSYVY